MNSSLTSMHAHRQSPTSRIASTVLASVSLLLASGCSLIGIESVEEADYQVVQRDDAFEIRDYVPLVVAETRVDAGFRDAGNQAFRRLFKYISGENTASQAIDMTAPVIAESTASESAASQASADAVDGEKIAMTAPVIAEPIGSGQADDAWLYRFVLPRSYTLDTAPRPLNPDVAIVELPPRRVAVYRYSGRSTDRARRNAIATLRDWMASQGLDADAESEPRWAGYNPPWTLPPFRRNEVLIDIAGR